MDKLLRYGIAWPLAIGVAWLSSPVAAGAEGEACRRCGWSPPIPRATVSVRSATGLVAALDRARPGTTILLEDGVYTLERMIDVAVPDVALRGRSGDRAKVVLRGAGMRERMVGVGISVSAPRITVADLTVGGVAFHGIQVRGERGASRVAIHNVRVVDTGQQLLKGSVGSDGAGPDEGLVACSCFEYTDHAPGDYTNGIDVLGARGWVVRDNRFLRIRGPREKGGAAGPAILFWRRSRDTRVERNLVFACFRGIALGLDPRASASPGQAGESFDHRGGIVRNNFVCNLDDRADEGIEANAAPGVRIEHNTVLVEGRLPWSIGVRFPATDAVVRNNLTNRPILARDGGRMRLEGNIVDARADWFADPRRGDLKLVRGDLAAVDAGVLIPEIRSDIAGQSRVSGKAPDAGAFEFRGGR